MQNKKYIERFKDETEAWRWQECGMSITDRLGKVISFDEIQDHFYNVYMDKENERPLTTSFICK